jgi:hypothetical protein
MGRALAKPIILSREKLMGFASLDPSCALYRSILEVHSNRHFFHADMRVTPDLSA